MMVASLLAAAFTSLPLAGVEATRTADGFYRVDPSTNRIVTVRFDPEPSVPDDVAWFTADVFIATRTGAFNARMRLVLLDGAGRGILDDVPAFELKQLVEQIDRSGRTNQPVYYDDDDDDEYRLPWDYRTFDLKVANMVLKTKIRRIEKDFREDPDEYDE